MCHNSPFYDPKAGFEDRPFPRAASGENFPIVLDLAVKIFVYFVHLSTLISNKRRNNMKVKPLSDRVLVKLEKNEAKTAGGIIIPDTAQEKTQTGSVVEVGPGTEKDPITVKAGQKVMYDKYAGTQVKIDGEDHLILKMSDIIAAIE
jgi:chaperonin GroES